LLLRALAASSFTCRCAAETGQADVKSAAWPDHKPVFAQHYCLIHYALYP
jgi:hypothetical protein